MKLPDLDTLSLPEQVAQMVVVRAAGYLFDHQIQYPEWEPPAAKLRYWLEDLNVGGVIFARRQRDRNRSQVTATPRLGENSFAGCSGHRRRSGATLCGSNLVAATNGDQHNCASRLQ